MRVTVSSGSVRRPSLVRIVTNSFSTVLFSPAGTVRFSTPTIVPEAGAAASTSIRSPRSRPRIVPIDGLSVRLTANVSSVFVIGSREA